MSKVDAQRAMREAKYARDRASGPSRREVAAAAGASATPAAGAAATPAAPRASATRARATEPAAASGELCGHKSMNGRSCTRAAGHAEKSHRYS